MDWSGGIGGGDGLTDDGARAEPDRHSVHLLSTAAHELQAHLTAILGYGELLLAETSPDDPRRAWISIVHEYGNRLSALIDELVDVSRLRAGRIALRPTVVDLSAALPRLLQALAASSGDHVLRADVAPAARWVWADPDRLDRIVARLVGCAITCSPAGGLVLVTARPDAASGQVALAVADSGPSIHGGAPDPRTRARPGDTGGARGVELALAIVRDLVELHGGAVRAERPATGGNIVRVTLPATPPAQDGRPIAAMVATPA